MKSHEKNCSFLCSIASEVSPMDLAGTQQIWQSPKCFRLKNALKKSERNELLRFTWQRWTNGETLVPSSIPTIWASGPALCQPLGPRCLSRKFFKYKPVQNYLQLKLKTAPMEPPAKLLHGARQQCLPFSFIPALSAPFEISFRYNCRNILEAPC